jgi:hypothetical protein
LIDSPQRREAAKKERDNADSGSVKSLSEPASP